MKKKKINLYSVGWFFAFSLIFSAVISFSYYMSPVLSEIPFTVKVFNFSLPYSFVSMLVFSFCYFVWAIVELYVMINKEKKAGFY